MSNRLKVAEVNTIEQLLKLGWSFRRIARELSLHRDTVARYAHLATATAAASKPAISTAGKCGRKNQCEPLRAVIESKLALGLSAQRIWQDLREESGFGGAYESVKRFVRALKATSPVPFRRMETKPGEQAQVDFGQGAKTRKPGCSKLCRPHALRIVLSYSRAGYSESVWRQDTESFLRALENSFIFFGGVPETLVVDNLKAAVLHADWFDPTLNRKLEAFARHYGIAILPTKPRMPRHKGKVERGVDYVQENALKGRVFESLEQQNRHLLEWEQRVADLRVHGTTKKQVRALFVEERPFLRPLPNERFPIFEDTERIVSRDAHIAVAKAFYSVPPEFTRRRVFVRYDARFVRIFDRGMKEIAAHARVADGKFSTHRIHLLDEKIHAVERGAEWLLSRAAKVGENTAAFAQAMLKERGIAGIRVLQGLLALTSKHSWSEIERVTALALEHGEFRLKTLRELLSRRDRESVQLQFLEDHPLIRHPHEYGDLVRGAFDTQVANGTSS